MKNHVLENKMKNLVLGYKMERIEMIGALKWLVIKAIENGDRSYIREAYNDCFDWNNTHDDENEIFMVGNEEYIIIEDEQIYFDGVFE